MSLSLSGFTGMFLGLQSVCRLVTEQGMGWGRKGERGTDGEMRERQKKRVKER